MPEKAGKFQVVYGHILAVLDVKLKIYHWQKNKQPDTTDAG